MRIVQLYLTITKGHDSPPLKSLVAIEKRLVKAGASVIVVLNTSKVCCCCC